MPWDEMETHTQEVQCCLPYIIFCNRGFFFHIYTILSYILRKNNGNLAVSPPFSSERSETKNTSNPKS